MHLLADDILSYEFRSTFWFSIKLEVIVLKLELSKLVFFVFIANNLIVMYYPLSNMLYFLLLET
jgi:hypothetical protein